MGPSYENFREIFTQMLLQRAGKTTEPHLLARDLVVLLLDQQGMGQRGRLFFESQTGATKRTVEALTALLEPKP